MVLTCNASVLYVMYKKCSSYHETKNSKEYLKIFYHVNNVT